MDNLNTKRSRVIMKKSLIILILSFGILFAQTNSEIEDIVYDAETDNVSSALDKINNLIERYKMGKDDKTREELLKILETELKKGQLGKAEQTLYQLQRGTAATGDTIEVANRAAAELCACLASFDPDSEDLDELSKGMDCLMQMLEAEAYQDLSETLVMNAMEAQCPAEKIKFEKLIAEE